ncbi:hypothetical protein HZS_1984 [Henneguya salminicola]|nr:hypothetical protein HZS_1984 [Henneguya salminicola]
MKTKPGDVSRIFKKTSSILPNENVGKLKNSTSVSSLSNCPITISEKTMANSSHVPLGELKLTTNYPNPDYEEEFNKKRGTFENDKNSDILIFPQNDVVYTKNIMPEIFKWYSLYGVKDIKNVNSIAKRSIDTLSSQIENHVISFLQEDYNGYFFTLPKFKPIDQPLYKHEYSTDSTFQSDIDRPLSGCPIADEDMVLYSGYLEMYPPLIDNTITIEKWITTVKPLKRYFSLNRSAGQPYSKLDFKTQEDSNEKYKGVIFIEYCSCFRQSEAVKTNAFEIHINQKIIILVAPSPKEFQNWVKSITDSTGIIFECDQVSKASAANSNRRNNNVQEGWAYSKIPLLVQYSKETDLSNQKQRNECRYKLYDIYSNIIQASDVTPIESLPSYVPGTKIGKNLKFQYKRIKISINYIEPFVLFFAVYDLKEGVKITEDFICDPIEPELNQYLMYNQGFTPYNNVIETGKNSIKDKSINSCVFNVPSVHDDYYIIARVYKLYTASLTTLWDYYIKGGNKYEAKLGKMFMETNEKAKKYLMPVGFSFKRVFHRGELDEETKFTGLIKYDYKYTVSEMIKLLQEYRTDSKLKSATINMKIDYSLEIDDEKAPINVLSSAYEAIEPFNEKEPQLFKKLLDLEVCPKRYRGYSYPVNVLFVNILSLNMINLKSTLKIKNFVVTIEIYDTQSSGEGDQLQLPLIFSRTCQTGFIKTASSTVICGINNANLMDEIKILLPANIIPNLHILLTYHSVSYKENSELKKKGSCDEILGYSWLRLFDVDCITISKDYSLPAVSTLPPNYLKYDLEKMEKSKTVSELKWIDGHGKPVIKLNLNFITNYHSSVYYPRNNAKNMYLYKIMTLVDQKGISLEDCADLCKNIKWLYALETHVMITHLYIIINFLLDVLLQSNKLKDVAKEKAEDIQKNTIRLMLLICGEVILKEREDLLRGFIKSRFNPRRLSYKATLHEIILEHLAMSTNYGSDPIMTGHLFKCCWFFLDIIYKSIAIEAISVNKITQNRKNFLKKSTIDDIGALVGTIICMVKKMSIQDPTGVKILNRTLSQFFAKCFSIIDRGIVMKFVSIMIENYQGDDQMMVSIRFDTLAQICNYEHFVQLNMPYETPSKNAVLYLRDLCENYEKYHFLLWLVFSQVKHILGQSYEYRKYGIRLMRNLLIKHNFDDRYNSEEKRCRIYMLYLPFVTILLEKYDLFQDSSSKSYIESCSAIDTIGSESPVESRSNTLSKTKDGRAGRITSSATLNADFKFYIPEDTSMMLSQRDLKELLLMFLHIIKSIDINFMMEYLKSYSNDVLIKGKQAALLGLETKKIDCSLLRRFLSLIRRTAVSANPSSVSRFTKADDFFKSYNSFIDSNRAELDSNLHCEVCLIVLDFMEKIFSTFKLFDIHILLLQLNTSAAIRKHHFAMLRQIIAKSPQILYKATNNNCYSLCVELLRLTGNSIENVRNEAKNMIYLILRTNYYTTGVLYHRAYVSVIMASSTVVENSHSFNFLYETMKELCNLVKCDEVMKNTVFSGEISDLTKRVKNIIRLTFRFKELESDPECLVDAHWSIANSFIGVPELRQTWLERIASLHERYQNYSEVAMCYIHIAALIANTLKRKSIKLFIKIGTLSEGADVFKIITPNITQNECSFKEEGLSDESKHTIAEFVANVNNACEYLIKAERYEVVPDICKKILPFLEKEDNYKMLSDIHGRLKSTYDKIIECGSKRYLGTYYRVSFYGHSFKEDHGCEYIYKEPRVTQLGEVVERLTKIYTPRCVNLSIIKESTKVKWNQLDQNNDYIQINVVRPIGKIKNNKGSFLIHHNNNTFIAETPFTASGKARGAITEQCKRITTFTTAKSFPYITKRNAIIKKHELELTPIEVAIAEMTTQVSELTDLIEKKPADMKGLQLRLQGSVSVTVNAGPLAYANDFLKGEAKNSHPTNSIEKLSNVFLQFMDICERALSLNAELIKDDQVEYHKGLIYQYTILSNNLQDILGIAPTEEPPLSDL